MFASTLISCANVIRLISKWKLSRRGFNWHLLHPSTFFDHYARGFLGDSSFLAFAEAKSLFCQEYMSHGARLCLKAAECLRTISWKGQGAEFLDTALECVCILHYDHHWIKIKVGINYINQAGFYFVSRQIVFHLSASNRWNSEKF